MPSNLAQLTRGATEIIGADELEQRLQAGEKLTVKVGFDPTAPDLHLGHTVVLTAMHRFQQAGHRVVFLIGDFTARIGDPTGRDRTRPPLPVEQIKANAATYANQVSGLLDMELTEVRYNSEWLLPLTAADFIRLAASTTLARMLERDDFSTRFHEEQPIALHEFLYPLAQGYDSVALQADIEMGGTDQKFNMLLGRDMQRRVGQRPQAVITWPLLEGTDGIRKMSKSLDNFIAIADPSEEMFGKLMSISDTVMWRYYELLSLVPAERIAELHKGHPRDAKLQLGYEITARYHGEEEAARAREAFVARFSRRELPAESDIEEIQIACQSDGLPLANAIQQANLAASVSEVRRLILQGAVRLDGVLIDDQEHRLAANSRCLVQVGKRRIAYLKTEPTA